MKKIVLYFVFALALISAHSHAQTCSITLTSGSLAIPDNYLVMLLGDTTSTFGNPTANSYTGTDPNEVVLDAFSMQDNTTGDPGVFRETITINIGTGPGEIPAGSYLMLRWFPTILASNYNASTGPGAGTAYGAYTSTTKEYPTDPNPQTTTPWTVPAAGDYDYDVWFVTANETSNVPYTASNVPANSAGLANFTVASVPEPSTLSLAAGAIAVGSMVLRRRR